MTSHPTIGQGFYVNERNKGASSTSERRHGGRRRGNKRKSRARNGEGSGPDYSVNKVQRARPPDDRDAAQDVARELARIASEVASIKGDAYNWLTDPGYRALVHRIEDAHASVEARRRVRLNEERGR